MTISEINGIKLNYETIGQGEPIVLLSGFGGDMHFWDSTVPLLSKDHMVIVLDNRGCGKTIYDKCSIEDMADDVSCLLDHLSIEKAHILGWSMGSHIAQHMAIRHPEKVKTLTLVSTYRYRPARSAYILSSMVKAMEEGMSTEHMGHVLNGMCLTEEFFRDKEKNNGEIRLPKITDSKGFCDQIKAIDVSDTTELAKNIRVPTLSVHGKDDIMVECSEGDALASLIDDCKIYRIDKVGHQISTKLYIDILREHLNGKL